MSTMGISTLLQVAVPQLTELDPALAPAVPDLPATLLLVPPCPIVRLPPLPVPTRAPLPPLPGLPEDPRVSEELPPQAGAPIASSAPQAPKVRRIRQVIVRKCSMRDDEMRALPAAAHAPPDRELLLQ